MAQIEKSRKITAREMEVLSLLKKHKGSKTVAELADELGMQKDSLTTGISVLRGKMKKAGKIALFAAFEPKRNTGGGARGNAVDIADALDNLFAEDVTDDVEDEGETGDNS